MSKSIITNLKIPRGVQHRFEQTKEMTSTVRFRIAERSRKVKGKIETKNGT